MPRQVETPDQHDKIIENHDINDRMATPKLQPFIEMEHENPNEISNCMLLATSAINDTNFHNPSANETSCMCSEIHRQQNEEQV
jgi:hypothetical protein